jgi:hypothetical protein
VKLITHGQASTVLGIAVVCVLISTLFLDNLARTTQNTSQERCSFIVLGGVRQCQAVSYNVASTGWPFVAKKSYITSDVSQSDQNYQQAVNALPLGHGSDIGVSLNALLLFVLFFSIYIFYKRHQSSIDKLVPDFSDAAADTDEPIISSSDMLSGDGLVSMDNATIAGFDYNLLANSGGRSMVLVSLHGNTHLHIIAIGDKSKLSLPLTQKIDSNFLVEIRLEGDFPTYFHLYCTPDKQIEIREILQPNTMEFFIDFCQGYDLEIYDDSLYASQASLDNDQIEDKSLIADTEKLLTNIGQVLDNLAKTESDTDNNATS